MSWVVRAGDTLPTLTAHLKQNSAPINLAGATVTFVHQSGTITCAVADAATGKVTFSATGLAAGEYRGVFRIVFGGGSRLTAPTTGYVTITVRE